LKRDIAIVICSRGREDMLARLLDDIDRALAPALEAGGLSVCTFVYAQNYPRAYLDTLARRFSADIATGRLILVEPRGPHHQIGYVVSSAIAALHARVDYRLAMLMDDDSLYRAEPQVDANLLRAARDFLDNDDRAYSIKLGQSRSLEYWPFIHAEGPIMPFKEKMLWISHPVMAEALALPEFAQLSVGEDAVLAALAWRGGADRCFGVFGIATFLHLGFEADGESATPPITGGYGELVGYVEGRDEGSELGKYSAAYLSGVVPHTILPEIFVGPGHPHFYINGIRPEAVTRYDTYAGGFHQLNRSG
jgi:hypothetical protein